MYGHPVTEPRVLVTGSSGTTGSRVAAALTGRAEVVRASRSPRPDRRSNLSDGEWVRFDWHDPSSFGAAVAGVDAVYLVPPTGDADPAASVVPFLERASSAGLRRAVLLGAQAIEDGDPGVGTLQQQLPDLVPESVVLRPSWFMQNLLGAHPLGRGLRADGVLRTATGTGRVPLVDADDIAAAAADVLVGTARSGQVVLTGPEALSYDDVAAILSRATGRPVLHRNLSEAELTDVLAASYPEALARALAGLDGRIAAGEWATPTDGVARITGRAPRSLEAFVHDHLGDIVVGAAT